MSVKKYRGMLSRAAASTVAVAVVTFAVFTLPAELLGLTYSWNASKGSVVVAFALFAVGMSGLVAGGLLLSRWATGRDWPSFAIASVGLVIWTILYDPSAAQSLVSTHGMEMVAVVYIGEILLTLPAQIASWYVLTRSSVVGDWW